MTLGAVCVVGAGSWGTTLAASIALRSETRLWARSPELAAQINAVRENTRYLGGVTLPRALVATSSLADALSGARIVFMAVPSRGFRAVLQDALPYLGPDSCVVSLTKGIEPKTNLRMSQVIESVAPGRHFGVLAGPNLAREVAEGQPCACVVAMTDTAMAREVQAILHTKVFRVYTGNDIVGCEIAGATKNVLAIASGVADGLGFGDNTRAVLITRGLAELGRLGMSLGGQGLTFGGLAGVGDLVATCSSTKSRNRNVGFELGKGRDLNAILDQMNMVAEGITTAGPLCKIALNRGVEMPIANEVDSIVKGLHSPREALANLMERPARSEWDEEMFKGFMGFLG